MIANEKKAVRFHPERDPRVNVNYVSRAILNILLYD